jgi:hypothetical protein
MKTFKTVETFVQCVGVIGLFAGCTITKCSLTGTSGASYQGYLQMTTGYPWTNSARLPDTWCSASLALGGLDRLEKCEYRKAGTNDCLIHSGFARTDSRVRLKPRLVLKRSGLSERERPTRPRLFENVA